MPKNVSLKLSFPLKDTPLISKNFKFFIFGYSLSVTGSWIQNAGQMWLVYKLTNSAFYLGLFSFLTSFLTLFFVLLGGFLIDIIDRKLLMILINSFSVFPSLILGILIHTDNINFLYLTLFVFLYNSISTLEIPLRQVFVSEIVPLHLITKGIAFQSLAYNFARLVGPFLSSLILTYGNIFHCFYLNALSSIIFVIFLNFVTPKFKKEKETSSLKFLESAKITLSFLKRKEINRILLSVVNYTFFGNSIIILFPYITNKIYERDPKDFTYLLTAVGLGAILGAFQVILKRKIKDEISHLWKATIILVLGILGLSFSKIWILALFFSFLIGFSFSNFFPVANGFLQKSTPDYLRGKIIGLFTLAYLGTFPLGDLTIGFLIETAGLYIIIFYVGILLIINRLLIGSLKN